MCTNKAKKKKNNHKPWLSEFNFCFSWGIEFGKIRCRHSLNFPAFKILMF